LFFFVSVALIISNNNNIAVLFLSDSLLFCFRHFHIWFRTVDKMENLLGGRKSKFLPTFVNAVLIGTK